LELKKLAKLFFYIQKIFPVPCGGDATARPSYHLIDRVSITAWQTQGKSVSEKEINILQSRGQFFNEKEE
jgi:hypothetical protein